MKIAGTGTVHRASIRRKDKAGSGGGSFASEIAAPSGTSAASAPKPIGNVDGLLALQEVADEKSERRKAREYGDGILSRLDDIRHALLTGTLPAGKLDLLMRQIRRGRDEVADPRLREILDEIELRAAVELAKLGRSA